MHPLLSFIDHLITILEHIKQQITPRIEFMVFCPWINYYSYLKGTNNKMQLTATQKVLLSIAPVDSKGNPAQVDDIPIWVSENEDSIMLDVAPDGMSAWAIANHLGSSLVTVTADADLGEGIVSIEGNLEFGVVAGMATGISIVSGAPVEQS